MVEILRVHVKGERLPHLYNMLAGLVPFSGEDAGSLDRLARMETLLLVLCIALIVLLVVYARGSGMYRRWVAARLRRRAEACVARSDVLRAGWTATIEYPGAGEMLRTTALVDRMDRRCVVLKVTRGVQHSLPPVGSPFMVTVAAPTTAYRFQAVVQDRRLAEGRALYYVARPPWVERVQRREFFRIRVELPAVISKLAPAGNGYAVYSATILDMSAGGFALRVLHRIEPGERVRVRLPDAALGGASFDARVIRCAPCGEAGDVYRLQCELLYVPEEARDRLVNYCFEVQRKWIRARHGLE